MLVVSNTSPILNLAIVGQLALLYQQFSQIQIPPAVLDELKIAEERPGSQAIQAAITAGWIQVQPIRHQSLFSDCTRVTGQDFASLRRNDDRPVSSRISSLYGTARTNC